MILKKSSLQHWLREAISIGLLVVMILAARSSFADHYFVPSGSMEYTLIAGDRVFVDKRAYGLRVPFTKFAMTAGDSVERGDIVIFDSPRDGKRLIKRIVAVGGDRVLIENGRLAINGHWLATSDGTDVEVFGEKTVRLNLVDGGGPYLETIIAAGKVLAIGDHRGNSLDGRIFGAVPEADIYGKAIAIYYRKGSEKLDSLSGRRDSGFGWREL